MITPLEIQNHQFNAKWKGYDKDEVKHFLYAIAEDVESLIEQNHHMAQELKLLRARINDMESREKILKETLITAQQIKTDVHENATKEATLLIKEAQFKADTMHEEAINSVKQIRDQIEELKRVRNDLLSDAEHMVSRFTHFTTAERSRAQESDKLQNFSNRPSAPPKNRTPTPASSRQASTLKGVNE